MGARRFGRRPRQLLIMRRFIILLLGLCVMIAWRGVAATGLSPGMRIGGALYLALFVIFALPLCWLLWRQFTRPGPETMALTAGTALVGLAGLLPITVVTTLFAGFATSLQQLYWLFYLWALLVLLLLTAALAWFAHRRLREPGARTAWGRVFGAPLLYVVAAHALVVVMIEVGAGFQRNAQANERAAKNALLKINQCAAQAAALAGANGYPVGLAAMGPAGTGCLDADLARGRLSGYSVEYLPGLPDASGRIAIYATCATPTDYPGGGGLTLASHQDTDDVGENGDAKLSVPMSCERAWHYYMGAISALQSLSACAIRYAHQRPVEGYPPSLLDLQGIHCDVGTKEIDYRPAVVAKGPRRSFEARTRGVWRGHRGSFLIDETGVVRLAREGEAQRDSPTLRDVAADAAAQDAARTAARATAGRAALAACEAGDAPACDRYAEHALFDLRREDEATQYFRRACDAAHEASCLSIRSSDPLANDVYDTSINLRGQCRDGWTRGCEGLAQLRRGMSRDETRKLEDWVRESPR
jgi:hypothetical protein